MKLLRRTSAPAYRPHRPAHRTKSPMTFAAYRPDGTLLWQESAPTSWTSSQTTQYLAQGATEQYYGTGLRLGPWALRGLTVPIAVDNAWKQNSNASPAPFYMSS